MYVLQIQLRIQCYHKKKKKSGISLSNEQAKQTRLGHLQKKKDYIYSDSLHSDFAMRQCLLVLMQNFKTWGRWKFSRWSV